MDNLPHGFRNTTEIRHSLMDILRQLIGFKSMKKLIPIRNILKDFTFYTTRLLHINYPSTQLPPTYLLTMYLQVYFQIMLHLHRM